MLAANTPAASPSHVRACVTPQRRALWTLRHVRGTNLTVAMRTDCDAIHAHRATAFHAGVNIAQDAQRPGTVTARDRAVGTRHVLAAAHPQTRGLTGAATIATFHFAVCRYLGRL